MQSFFDPFSSPATPACSSDAVPADGHEGRDRTIPPLASLRVRDHSRGLPGEEVFVNAPEPFCYSNDFVEGKVLLMHRGEPDWLYAEHFESRKRRWELRMQVIFSKTFPTMDCPVLGVEVDQPVNPSWPLQCAVSFAKTINHARGDPFVFSLGPGAERHKVSRDNGEDDTQHEFGSALDQRPGYLLFPAWTLDTILMTPMGEEPPPINGDALPTTPVEERRSVQWGQAGMIYTCVYYSAYVDFLFWELSHLPLRPSLHQLFGDQPLHIVLSEPRHAHPRHYIMDLILEHSAVEGTVESPTSAAFASGGRRPSRPGSFEFEGPGDAAPGDVEESNGWQSCRETDSESAPTEDERSESELASPGNTASCGNYRTPWTTAQPNPVRALCREELVGAYFHRKSLRKESTLVLQKDSSFWHAFFAGPRVHPGKDRGCLDPRNLTESCGVPKLCQERTQSCGWEQLEIIGRYEQSASGGVVLTCEAWRATSGGPDRPDKGAGGRDYVLWAIQENGAVLDTMVNERQIKLHYMPVLPTLSDQQLGSPRTSSELFLVEDDPDPATRPTLDDPAICAMFMLVGFSRHYMRTSARR